jgi:integrase
MRKGCFYLLNRRVGSCGVLSIVLDGKEKLLSIGVYPDVALVKAREKRDEARKLIADQIDPSENRKAIKASRTEIIGNSFEVIAREWFAKNAPTWVVNHANKIIRCLELNIFPWLGTKPITTITAPELLSCLRRIEARGVLDTAHRAQQHCSRIFRYAIATGRASHNPVPDLQGALPPIKATHYAAITDPKAIPGLLRSVDSYQGTFVVKCALQLAPLVFVRPGELRMAEWPEIDLDKAEWNIPAERMKMRQPLLVPLSKQAITILRELQPLTGTGRYVFPSLRGHKRPMSENAILAALRRMGYSKEEMTGHGFRAMARTVLDEVLGVRPDYIEHQLAHAVRDPNGRAYNRTAHLAGRRIMMQQWADYLEELKVKTTK